jgi:hypothetical protein
VEKKLSELSPGWSMDGCIMFDCPTCDPELAHMIGVPTEAPFYPGGPVWKMTPPCSGTSMPDFDLVTLSPSVDCTKSDTNPCSFHGWVRNGIVSY